MLEPRRDTENTRTSTPRSVSYYEVFRPRKTKKNTKPNVAPAVTNKEEVSPILEDKHTGNDNGSSWTGMAGGKDVTRDVAGEEAGHVIGT